MIRNLKVLVAAAMALAAFGGVSATSAQAIPEIHCSVEPCTATLFPDAAVNAHHVFVIENAAKESVSTTCNEISGHATSAAKTTTQLTFTDIKYTGCKVAGTPSVIHMNKCDYLFRANGSIKIECPVGKVIEITADNGCVFTIPAQEPAGGVTYTNIGKESNNTTELTVTFNITKITGTAHAGCPIPAGAFTLGRYTTGNTKITGETDPGGVMANAWWTA